MKKLLLALFFMMGTGIAAQAQLTFGIKAGLSSSKVEAEDFKDPAGTYGTLKNSDNITGYHAGAFVRLKALGFMVQPEALLTSSGGRFEVAGQTGNVGNRDEEFKFTRLDVPLLVGYSLLNVIRVNAGPVASMVLDSKFKGDINGEKVKEYFDTADWGWQAGVGFDISRLTADIRYERIKRTYANAQNVSYGVMNQQYIFSLGYKILGK